MKGVEAIRIFRRIESIDPHDIPIIFYDSVAEWDLQETKRERLSIWDDDEMIAIYLIVEVLYVVHPLEVWMKRFDHNKRNFQQILDNKSERHIIGKTNSVSDRNESPVTRQWHDFYGQCSTQTKPSTSSREPKSYFLIFIIAFGWSLMF